MSSFVSESHGSKVQKTSEFFKLGLFDLLSILFQNFLSNDRFSLWLLLTILGKILFKLIETTDIIRIEIRNSLQLRIDRNKNITIDIDKMRVV